MEQLAQRRERELGVWVGPGRVRRGWVPSPRTRTLGTDCGGIRWVCWRKWCRLGRLRREEWGSGHEHPQAPREAVAVNVELRAVGGWGVKGAGVSFLFDTGQHDMHFCLKKLEAHFALKMWRVSGLSLE